MDELIYYPLEQMPIDIMRNWYQCAKEVNDKSFMKEIERIAEKMGVTL